MAGGLPANSVWTAMSYTPPRGRCNHKSSLMSPACPCLRFMLHPVKAATSFECDGCGHHASFHSLENREEDEVVRRWQEMEKARIEEQQKNGAGALAVRKKRKMIEGKSASAGAEVREVLEIEDDAETEAGDDVFTFRAGSSSTGGASRTTTTGRKKRGAAPASTSGRGR